MQASLDGRPRAMLAAAGLLAVITGLVVSLLEPKWAIAGILGAALVGLVLYDYRAGAIFLTLLLPWVTSPLVPQTHGFDLVNFLILATCGSLVIRRAYSKESTVPLPVVVRWCYLLPIAIGVVTAWPHLAEGARNFPSRLPGELSAFSPTEFLKSRVIKPLYFLAYAFLVANAARDSKKPERLLWAFGLSATLPAFAIMVEVARGAGAVADRDNYLQGLGLHPNSYGMLLALASGPLLFLSAGALPRFARLASAAAFAVVSIGLLLTGSRGGAVVYAVVILVWLIQRHRFTDFVLAIALAATLAFAVPDKVWDRLTLGLDEIGSSTNSRTDELSKGRFAGWALLAPEVLDSPIWGQGIGSVAWNAATSAGQYRATLSHNMYLDVLLDLGILGLIAIGYLYFRYANAFRILSTQESIPPALHAYFAGAFASFLGMLLMAFTNGWWMPHPEQTYLWFGLGLVYAYWALSIRPEASRRTKIRRNKHRHSVMHGHPR